MWAYHTPCTWLLSADCSSIGARMIEPEPPPGSSIHHYFWPTTLKLSMTPKRLIFHRVITEGETVHSIIRHSLQWECCPSCSVMNQKFRSVSGDHLKSSQWAKVKSVWINKGNIWKKLFVSIPIAWVVQNLMELTLR